MQISGSGLGQNAPATNLLTRKCFGFPKRLRQTLSYPLLFVNAVRSCLSEKDAIIRWGGDEFVAVAHGIDRFEASKIGDAIVTSVRSISLPGLENRRKITSSVGLSFFEPDDQSVKDVLSRADKAVYEVKESGRDDYKIL